MAHTYLYRTSFWKWLVLLFLGLFLFIFLYGLSTFPYDKIDNVWVASAASLGCCVFMLLMYLWLSSSFEHRKVKELKLSRLLPDLGKGLALGFGLFVVTVLLMFAFGLYRIDSVQFDWSGLLRMFFFYAVVAVGEEILARALVMRMVEERWGTVAALVISSLLFGFMHYMNPNAGLWPALAIALVPLISVSYFYSRTLWMPIGLHWAWNFTQGCIFGISVSGTAESPSVISSTMNGPDLLTGGAFGAEDSIILVILGMALSAWLLVAGIRKGNYVPSRCARKRLDRRTAIFSITSPLHNNLSDEVPFNAPYDFFGDDFSTYGTHLNEVIFVRTGGTEGIFKELVDNGTVKGPVKLLTSGTSNSLAASMEILAYLNGKGIKGNEILHGRPDFFRPADDVSFIRPLPPIDFGGKRFGVIGRPSDWLIASGVDYAKAKEKLNAELVDIPMDELLKEMEGFTGDVRSFAGSEAIYDSLKAIVARHGLSGLTLRCFDLLDTLHNTGCLAVARLNAEGIPASCEGDIPALFTLAWLQQDSGRPGFQCNLSRIEGDTLLFAHCSVPLNMVERYRYDTHFESGIGTAIKGEFDEGPVRICKISPDLESMVEIPGTIVGNGSEPLLCRTQVLVVAPGAADYMLRNPLANHHIITR